MPYPLEDRVERARATRVARLAERALPIWSGAGADLLAGGLTFAAVFAFLPALLLTTGLVSLVVVDEARRLAIAQGIGDVFPPLAGVAKSAMDARLEGRINASLIAAIGSVWGASAFYGAVDEAFARVFHEAPRRSGLFRIWRGMITVFMLLGLVVVMLFLVGLSTRMSSIEFLRLGRIFETLTALLAPLLAIGVWVATAYAAYRFVPVVRVSRSVALLPAVVVGIALAVWTQAMAFLSGIIVGGARELGPGIGVLAILMWLWISFNILIFGAAWVRIRLEDSGVSIGGSATLDP